MSRRPSRLQQFRSWGAELCRRTLEPMLYSAGIYVYAGGVKLASLRHPKARKMVAGHREVFTRLKQAVDSWREPVVWLHAASLGEFEQGRPLLEMLRREHPEKRIVLSFFSPSGYEVRKDWKGADAVVYLPFDTPRNVRRFLDIIRPEKAIFVKYEFWRNYLYALWNRNVPTYLISAVFRKDQAFFRRSSAWYRQWLKLYSHIYVQDEGSCALLARYGIENVTVAGDTRFDRVTDIMRQRREIPLLERFRRAGGERPVIMAGSSWPEDEKVYAGWVNGHDVRLVIAPHEFDEVRICRLKELFPGAVTYTDAERDPQLVDGAKVLVMNCFGLLSSAYTYADIAYVGGGFGAGLHNINEAAVYGIPVIYGPNNRKFIEARELREAGGGFEVTDASTFARTADSLLDSETCRTAGEKASAYIRSKLGATDRIFCDLF